MTALERAIGTKLLTRRTTGCDLTDEGQVLLQSLERIETEFLASEARLRGKEASLSGVIRIGAPDGFGGCFVAPRLLKLSSRHPDITVQLVPVPRAFSLSQREADIAVSVGRPSQGKLVARKLTDYSLSLYASRAYLAEHPTPRSVGDLAKHRLLGYVEDLVYSPELNYTVEFWRQWRSRLEIASVVGQLEAVSAGAGIAILHDYLAAPYPNLRLVLPELRLRRAYWLVVHESMRDNAKVKAVADFLADAVKSAAPFVRTG